MAHSNSYGNDDEEEEQDEADGYETGEGEESKSPTTKKNKISTKGIKLAPLFKKASQCDACFEDFQIVCLIGKGTFGKVIDIKLGLTFS